MRSFSAFGFALAVAIAPTATAQAPKPTQAQVQVPSVIGSHQIDRYEAIRQLQADLKSDPNNKLDWIILGELAHEVASDLPSDQDVAYYRISRDAYEHASRLDPANPGLKAAVQFATDQEAARPNLTREDGKGSAPTWPPDVEN